MVLLPLYISAFSVHNYSFGFIARVNPRTKAKTGDIMKVAFDANKIHLFDKETERVIMN